MCLLINANMLGIFARDASVSQKNILFARNNKPTAPEEVLAGQFSGRAARVNGLNELKSHYAVKRFKIFGPRARMEPSDYLPTYHF